MQLDADMYSILIHFLLGGLVQAKCFGSAHYSLLLEISCKENAVFCVDHDSSLQLVQTQPVSIELLESELSKSTVLELLHLGMSILKGSWPTYPISALDKVLPCSHIKSHRYFICLSSVVACTWLIHHA